MSLLGTLEQLRLPKVLQRIEAHEKTGLLVVRQGVRWVEFYFRNGHLLCIGPVRTSATLVDRLLQDKIISQQVCQEVKHILGGDEQREMRIALALMDRGFVNREELRAWTTGKSLTVLSAILAWTTGEVYFEEDTPPPSDRLLVSLSIASLIQAASATLSSPQTQPIQTTPVTSSIMKFNITQESPSSVEAQLSPVPSTSAAIPTVSPLAFGKIPSVKPKADIARVPTLMGMAQFLDETPYGSRATRSLDPVLPQTESFAPFFGWNNNAEASASLPNTNEISFASLASLEDFSENKSLIQPELVKYPAPPKRIDTSFMRPDMVLVPADVSAFREQNSQVQVTPDQWRILTCVDGSNSLQMTCQHLGLSPDMLCVLAGELVAEGLIYVVPPEQVQLPGLANNVSIPGLANASVASSSAASRFATTPAVLSTDAILRPPVAFSFETESQWGNGGNGATFIPGRGWVTTPQPMQPLPSSGPLVSPSGVYALGGGRLL